MVETCRRQKRNVLSWMVDAVEARFAGKTAPSLVRGVNLYSWNPITARLSVGHSTQSLTDTSMRTLFGDGMGIYSTSPGIDFYLLSDGTGRQPEQDDPFDGFIPDGPDDGGGDTTVVSSFDPNTMSAPPATAPPTSSPTGEVSSPTRSNSRTPPPPPPPPRPSRSPTSSTPTWTGAPSSSPASAGATRSSRSPPAASTTKRPSR